MSESRDERRLDLQTKAQQRAMSASVRDMLVRKEIETERSRVAAKNASLRALRLAKEAIDKTDENPWLSNPNPIAKPRAVARKRRIAP